MATAANGNMNILDGVEALRKGAGVWYRPNGGDWTTGELVADPTDQCCILLPSGSSVVVPTTQVQPANPKLQDGIANLTHLSYLNEPCILHDLRFRYSQDQIYTFAGPVLVAVNPCRELPLYTPEAAGVYKRAVREHATSLGPHVYLVAAAAFREMLRQQQSQSLVVSGESGAGKTETAKRAMQYFATLAGGTGIEDQVLETNPILEAFGNAKTLRNHNSSRFGKLTEIHFGQSNHICGARIRTYLLEKSRVVAQLPGERSYHIFYMLMRGVTHAERGQLRLPQSLTGFRYLNQSGCTEIDGVDDALDFRRMRSAMLDVGINQDAQMDLFRLLSAVLWLGNVSFKPGKAHDSSDVVEAEAWATACQLLGVVPRKLAIALTQKKIVTRGEVVSRLRTVEEACDTRDALSKALYAALFGWVVEAINGKLSSGVDRKSSGRFIAILDIYGFEAFERNSFEQLCINYANERLQQQFNEHLFRLEQELYKEEGIDWTNVTYTDNSAVLDCIEGQPPRSLGILSVLDSQCRFPKASDQTFLQKLRETLEEHPNFRTNPRDHNDFIVQHYAGAVQYTVNGFLDKNKDTLGSDLVEAVQSSNWPFLLALGQGIAEDAAAKRGGATVSGRFSQQLRELLDMLDTTGLHFVRCIKPNAALAPGKFVPDMVVHQLRNSGVLEVARVARAGFPTRYVHGQFVERYVVLLPRELQAGLAKESAVQACLHLLQAFRVEANQFQIGRTRIFFRVGVLGYIEDAWARMQRAVPVIQAGYRMHRARKAYLRLREAALQLQSGYRARAPRALYTEMLRRHRASQSLARGWRAYLTRCSYLETKAAAIMVQRAWRAKQHLVILTQIRLEREARQLAAQAAEEERKRQEESFEAMKREFGVEKIEDIKAALAAYLKAGKNAPDLSLRSLSLQRRQSGDASLSSSYNIVSPRQKSVPEDRTTSDGDAMFLPSPPVRATSKRTSPPPSRSAGASVANTASRNIKFFDSDSDDDKHGHPTAPANIQRSKMNRRERPEPELINDFGEESEEEKRKGSGSDSLNPLALKAIELENLKLKRQLEIERQLRERNDSRMEDSQKQINEQMRMMQEYIKLLAAQQNPGGGQRPQSIHSRNNSEGMPGMDAINSNHSGQLQTWGSSAPSSTGQLTPNGSGALLTPQHSVDGMAPPPARPRSNTGANAPGPGILSDARFAPLASAATGRRMTAESAGSGASTPSSSGGPRAQLSNSMKSNDPAAERVASLDNEFYTISRTLTDDAVFIQEVKEGLHDAPGMDPSYELQRLKLKFSVWKKEFKEKIKTAETMLKKMDRLDRQQQQHQQQQRAVSAPRRGNWTPPRGRTRDATTPTSSNSQEQGFSRSGSSAAEDAAAATRRRIRGFFTGNLFGSRKDHS